MAAYTLQVIYHAGCFPPMKKLHVKNRVNRGESVNIEMYCGRGGWDQNVHLRKRIMAQEGPNPDAHL